MNKQNDDEILRPDELWEKSFENVPISKNELGNKNPKAKSIYTLDESIEKIKHSDL